MQFQPMRYLLGILVVLISTSKSFGLQEPTDSIQLQPKAPEVILNGLTFSFENQKDTSTLKPFDFGTLSMTWDSTNSHYQSVVFQYRRKGDEQWLLTEEVENNFASTIINLPENTLFEYHIGARENGELHFNETTAIFNTYGKSLFENHSSKGKEEAAKLNWAIPHDKLNELLLAYPNASYVVKYNTKIGKKQHEAMPEKSPWEYLDEISINEVSLDLHDLVGGEKYVYKVGVRLHEDIEPIWSKEGKFETERSWGVFRTLILIGALGMFIFGMKIMSEGLQKAAGSRLRNMLASITSNRFKGVLTGFGITSVVQSSSVTTVMTVSFVNAGLMTLKQSVGVLMGANIGTTLTAWLILFFGFKVDISAYALVLIAIGAPMLFFSKGSIKIWASVIIGFALLFMGLGFLKESVPELGVDSALVQFFIQYKDAGFFSTILFVGLGTLVTVIIQSSSAAMALTMAMVGGGVLPFEVAAAMILGENIGTTITAQLAALIGNVHAKRAARVHAFFNLIGVIWCVFVFHWFLQLIGFFIKGDPFTDPEAANLGLAVFHSAFNIANVILLIWFVPKLVLLAEKSVRSKGFADEEFHLDYIGTGMMGTPDLSILEAKKEVAKFGSITARMSSFIQTLLVEQNKKKRIKLHDKIAKYEEITDRVEIEVANYLAKVSSGDMTEQTAHRIRSMNSIVNDLERIGDIFYQMAKTIERKDDLKIYFLPGQRQSLQEMFKLVDKAFIIMVNNLENAWDGGISIDPAIDAERAINSKRDEMRKEHLENMSDETFNMESGMIFNNLFSSCEKVGDHIINVSEAVCGNIG